ncbi:prepilin peptidase [Xenorhabdus innexi]|uniref:Bifunctional prepilin peptidase: leader peptidase methyl transferase (General Secretory Pathway) n=1 Tax=Xenorhabdus innexi TaxID=290109 RepID=A0A1N6N0E7_9GAMM|nr:A24 family peptidase [Xenorhabdus innexi]PHM33504.1 type 4 prepilin-like proteins leader peptide processing enzyme [Xenorhabdus innexi]SIP74581.1 Bifunctional prepilin peptidase: leader peptidase; methyl transferase (General Secretory Pathway) [Xenorhabdus innexi]
MEGILSIFMDEKNQWFNKLINLNNIAISFFCITLVFLAIIDIKTYQLPDVLTQPLLWFGLVFNSDNNLIPIKSAVYGAISGYLFLWLLYWLCRSVLRKEGIGYGDLKLTAAIGAWIGAEMIPVLMLLSSTSGLLGFVVIWLQRKNYPEFIAFGPYLCFSAILLMFLNLLEFNIIGI